ncbi:MAG: hypothetical protein R3178_09420, partial [Rhodothermales bacterium]|nr:hypothetical protein [Rhodothermales bacterium]
MKWTLAIALLVAVLLFAESSSGQIRPFEIPAEVPIPEAVDLAESFTFRMFVRMGAAPDMLPALA